MVDGETVEDLRQWVGRSETETDTVVAGPFHRLAATLGVEAPPLDDGDPVPLLWHWLVCRSATPRLRLGEDGHPARGVFLPPVALRRRLYGGGRIEVRPPLLVGERVRRVSTVADVVEKEGRTGPLVVVTIHHEYSVAGGTAVVEDQDLIYTDATPVVPAPMSGNGPPDAPLSGLVPTDEVMLFRYSALTFNGHRIHYDHPYATGVEGYPGLVVHGPLVATLLAGLVRHSTAARVSGFSFRATAPLYCGDAVALRGWPGDEVVRLAAYRLDGTVAMEAEAVFE